MDRGIRSEGQKHFVIDGEAVALGVAGISDFNGLHSRKHDHEVQLYALGILALAGDDLRSLPLHMRKANLAQFLARRLTALPLRPSSAARSVRAPTGTTFRRSLVELIVLLVKSFAEDDGDSCLADAGGSALGLSATDARGLRETTSVRGGAPRNRDGELSS